MRTVVVLSRFALNPAVRCARRARDLLERQCTRPLTAAHGPHDPSDAPLQARADTQGFSHSPEMGERSDLAHRTPSVHPNPRPGASMSFITSPLLAYAEISLQYSKRYFLKWMIAIALALHWFSLSLIHISEPTRRS
eukprot:7362044-Prymnesium_polylepis.1